MRCIYRFFIFVLILPLVSCSSPERTAMEFFESIGKGDFQKAYNMMHPLKESRIKNDLANALLILGATKGEEEFKKAAQDVYMTMKPVIISCKKVSANKAYVFCEYDAKNPIFPEIVIKDTSIFYLEKYKGRWYMVDEVNPRDFMY